MYLPINNIYTCSLRSSQRRRFFSRCFALSAQVLNSLKSLINSLSIYILFSMLSIVEQFMTHSLRSFVYFLPKATPTPGTGMEECSQNSQLVARSQNTKKRKQAQTSKKKNRVKNFKVKNRKSFNS